MLIRVLRLAYNIISSHISSHIADHGDQVSPFHIL